MVTRNLDREARDELDAALTRRPDDVDPETGLAPPSWWRGEHEAAQSAANFLKTVKR